MDTSTPEPDDADLLMARAMAEDMDELRSSMRRIEQQLGQVGRALDDEVAARTQGDDMVLKRLRPMIDGKRIDRQVGAVGRRVASRGVRAVRAVRPEPPAIMVICPRYPGGRYPYGGEFVRARVRRYAEYGIRTHVVVTDLNGRRVRTSVVDGVKVHRTSREMVAGLVDQLEPVLIGVHHMEPALWEVLQPFASTLPFVVWVHGFEARDWRELAFNFDEDYLREHREFLDELNRTRRSAMSEVFESENIHTVFVSHFMQGIAEDFVRRPPRHPHVIPNVVDDEVFPYRERSAEQRRRVLWVRSFNARNYANDLSRDAVLRLADSDHFAEMHVTIVGDGKYFDECTGPLHELDNVTISRGFVSPERLAELHGDHGVMLVPSRWDSQGLTSLEAMSSGLVPVTTAVAAVPEYVPEDAGVLCPPEDAACLAEAVLALQDDPDQFLERSRRAAAAVRASCGVERTIGAECELVASLAPRIRRSRWIRGRLQPMLSALGR
ncbi:MAG: glycosyltransferase family 4 protein [Ilumatobacter sp.]|uniref:glycosyltransferase family 4 protein n=1 Tax=Ilumatobacter sp. TaxID=1967498 RepID=UPI00262A7596|nr:glycosyltransferase family 4 protein [Ilumatobacter sp.]MDJ0768354.1 glycosyltransferase family 4 protein [Ilumatobacter sp.]